MKAGHRPRETDLRAVGKRRTEAIPPERLPQREHVGVASVRDAPLVHRLDEVLGDVDGHGLAALLEVQRVTTRIGAHVE